MSLPRIGERLGDGKSMENGFTRLEYIQSTGTQWIDTGVFADQDCEAIVECSADVTNQHYIFGARTAASSKDMFCFILVVPATAWPQFDGNSRLIENKELLSEVKNRSTIVLNSSGCFINGKTFTTFASYSNFTTPVTVALFGMRQASGLDGRTFSGKIYSFQIKKEGKLLLDLIPALDLNGKPCMFDKVSQTPLYNKGEGEFVYKRSEELPAGLRRVEYVENTEQHAINSGIVLTKDSVIDCEIAIMTTWGGYQGIYGANLPFGLLVQPGTTQLAFCNDEPSGLYRYYHTTSLQEKVSFRHEYQKIFVNGKQLNLTFFSQTGLDIEDGRTCYIFDYGTRGNHSWMRLYSFSIAERGTVVYQLIPCIDEESKLLLYETVSKSKIYLPSHFVSGEIIEG